MCIYIYIYIIMNNENDDDDVLGLLVLPPVDVAAHDLLGARNNIPTPDFRISPVGRKHRNTHRIAKSSLAAGSQGWG